MKKLTPCSKMLVPAFLAGMVALLVATAVPIPSATASPGCHSDYSTPDSYLGCWGGNWQNQDGSSPDTYGSFGPRGYLAENKKMGIGGTDAVLLQLGQIICEYRSRGLSETFIEAKLVDAGNSRSTAQILAVNAGFLCSPNGTPRG